MFWIFVNSRRFELKTGGRLTPYTVLSINWLFIQYNSECLMKKEAVVKRVPDRRMISGTAEDGRLFFPEGIEYRNR